jgi:hypothetical protein
MKRKGLPNYGPNLNKGWSVESSPKKDWEKRKMICFEIELNGQKACTAGVGQFGVLTTTLSWVRNREQGSDAKEVVLNVGGLTDDNAGEDEFVDWIQERLTVGTEIKIKIIDAQECDEPSKRNIRDPADRVEKAREYYEQLLADSKTS